MNNNRGQIELHWYKGMDKKITACRAISIIEPLAKKKLMEYYNGKVVLVVGASEGLGYSIVSQLTVETSARVIATSRSATKIKQKLKLLPSRNVRGVALSLNASDAEIAKSILAIIESEEGGKIDILINCAGMGFRGKVSDTNLEVHRQVFQVDYFGQVAIIKSLLGVSSHIIQVSSVQGYVGIGERAPYAAAKHALVGFIDALRTECDEANTRITLVSPGYISTNHSANAITGNGSAYSQTDETTSTGYSPEYVANQLLVNSAQGKREVIIADFKTRLVIKLRLLFPNLCFRILRNRQLGIKESLAVSVFKWLLS